MHMYNTGYMYRTIQSYPATHSFVYDYTCMSVNPDLLIGWLKTFLKLIQHAVLKLL